MRIDFLQGGAPKTLFIHEVWWADLDNKKAGLWAQIEFWLWALGSWGFVQTNELYLLGAIAKMRRPLLLNGRNCHSLYRDRLRLWFVDLVLFLIFLGLLPLTYTFKRIGVYIPADIIYRYLGDVKIYQDFRKPGAGVALSDIDEAPRVPIRRRMVRTLIDMYFADYDRWYIAAHSLGTVAAWNGIMETAHCLPNYLDRDLWLKCQAKCLGDTNPHEHGTTAEMRPSRPSWLRDQDVIFRNKLFSRLRGLVTYGSPLDKFACMWGHIVPINQDETAFPENFEWINIYDTSDPVAAKLEAFTAAINPPEASPMNYAYKASRLLLLSHIKYLTFCPDRPDGFVNRLVSWVTTGQNFPPPAPNDPSWGGRPGGDIYRSVWWIVSAVVLALLDGCLASLLHQWQWFAWIPLIGDSIEGNALLVFGIGVIVVTTLGLVLKVKPKLWS